VRAEQNAGVTDDERTAAELAVRNVLARVAQLADLGELDEYLDLFADDAVWAMPANDVVGLAASERRGRDEIAAGVAERRAAGLQGPGAGTMHLVSTTAVVVGSADEATATSCFQFCSTGAGGGPATLLSVGRYEDVLKRTDQGWKLARRSITLG
jgi:ketosteroid isomerase-like protein